MKLGHSYFPENCSAGKFLVAVRHDIGRLLPRFCTIWTKLPHCLYYLGESPIRCVYVWGQFDIRDLDGFLYKGPTELSKFLHTLVPCHHEGIGLLGNALKVESTLSWPWGSDIPKLQPCLYLLRTYYSLWLSEQLLRAVTLQVSHKEGLPAINIYRVGFVWALLKALMKDEIIPGYLLNKAWRYWMF